ncbi:MAG: hypothetical protein KF689_14335 [Gemmatimonadaceae bacterium]|nr:hypothetical protein [Gemmatimonadaceae bacterium]
MKLTPAQVSATWTRVMRSSPKEWAKLEARSGPFQDELTGFVLGFTHHLGEDAQEVARDCMVACYEIYREHRPGTRPATEDQISAQFERSEKRIADAAALVDAGYPAEQMFHGSPQPHLIAAVFDAVIGKDSDDPGVDDDPALDDDELWDVVAVLDTVIAVLDECAQRAPAP